MKQGNNETAGSQEDHVFPFGETEVRTGTDFLEIMFWVRGERSCYTAILPLLNLAAFLICVLHDFCMIHVLFFYAQKQIDMFCCGQKRGKLETQSFL
jgi:hypothetical protein